ncbi:MAG: Uma2 family endonuclease [Chloroflexi bacterium CFX4]|nr:Uma2 family endonuclease [Chloroflexi bacterium CFX4]MDL1923525.1 Uma2 family endonuclease [Chloroflexi bacterium CFX3]
MSEQTVVRRGMALMDFLERSTEKRFELIDGEVYEMSPSVLKHSLLIRALFRALDNLVLAGDQWESFSETTFIPPDQSAANWLADSLVPDVALFDKAAFAEWRANTTDADSRPIALIPALVAEVLSPTDRQSVVARKIQRYLALGVRLIWTIDPQVEQVTVYTHGSNQATLLSAADTISAGDLLPDFRLSLATFFNL